MSVGLRFLQASAGGASVDAADRGDAIEQAIDVICECLRPLFVATSPFRSDEKVGLCIAAETLGGMPMRMISVVICLLLSVASAHAEMNVKDFFAKYDRADAADKQFMETILGQVGNGLSWANSRLGFLKRQRLFCQPGDLALTDVQTIEILRKHTRTNQRLEQAPFGLGLLVAFEEEYPCPK